METEIDPIKLHDERAGRDGDPAGPLRNYQREMTIRMFDALSNKGVVFVGQAPPAFGKTVVIRAAALALVESGKKVLITEPTYSRLDELRIALEGVGLQPSTLMSRNKFLEDGLVCPKLGERPNYIWCREQHQQEAEGAGCKGFECPIKAQEKTLAEARIAVTVAAALVHHDAWLDNFDVVIFDESHTLPGQIEGARVRRIGLPEITALANYFGDLDGFKKARGIFDKLEKRRETRDLGPKPVEQAFGGSVKDIAAMAGARIAKAPSYDSVPVAVRNAFHALEGVGAALEQSGHYKFIGSGGTLYAAPPSQSVSFRPPNRRKPINASIALISATIENPKFHANDCGFGRLGLAAPFVAMSNPVVEQSERKIFSLIDGPSLKVTGDASDLEARALANETIIEVISHFKLKTLILCRSDRDRRAIHQALQAVPQLRARVLEVEDAQFEDADHLERHIRTEMEKGHDLVVATASSKLWEGANLDIQLLIIDSLPYVAPDPWNTQRGSWTNSKPFRTMLRRFQQGVGRLIRRENQWGMAVVMDGRLHTQWKLMRSQLPSYVADDIHPTRRDKLIEEMQAFMQGAQERIATGKVRSGHVRQVRLLDAQQWQ